MPGTHSPQPTTHMPKSLFGDEFETESIGDGLGPVIAEPQRRPTAEPISVKELRLSRFRGFEDFTIALADVNILVGANNSGKSTILKSIAFGHSLLLLHFARDRDGFATFHPGRSVPRSLLPVAKLRDLWPGGRMRSGNQWVPSSVAMTLSSGDQVEFGIIGPWNAATSKIEKPALERMNRIPSGVIEAFTSRPPVFVPASIGIVDEEEYRTPARCVALATSGRHNEIVRNYLLELKGSRPERFVRLTEVLKTYFDTTLEVQQFDATRDQFLEANYRAKDATHDLFSVGGGFLQIVELLGFILRRDPGVVLLDEPDAHLNSSLQHALIDVLEALRSEIGFQLIMATHSKEIINYVDPSRIIPIDRTRTHAVALGQHASTVTVLKELGAIDNVDAYQVVKRKAVLFVEGPTDRELIPRLATRIGSTIFDGDSRVAIVPTGGADRSLRLDELKVVEMLLGGAVNSLQIRDRDGRPERLVSTLKDRAERPLFVWSSDTLENYLIIPTVIQRIIASEKPSDAPTVEQLNGLIRQLVEGLFDQTVDRVSTRIVKDDWNLNRTRVEPGQANPEAREYVRSRWGTFEQKISVVDGKALLKQVRESVQTEFGVSFGNARIIEEAHGDELAEDMKKLVAEATKIFSSHTSR